MAIEHSTIADPEIHEPKGVASASSGQVYIAAGTGSGSWATLGKTVVTIESASDFPTATLVGGVLTHVLADAEYVINQDVSITNPLAFPGTGNRAIITATNRAILTYTGTNSLFKDPDAEGDIELFGLLQFEAPNGNFFDVTAVTGGFSFQTFGGTRFTNTNTLGTFDCNGTSGLNFFFGTFSNFDQGLTIIDAFFFESNLMFMFGNNVASCVYYTITGASTTGSVNMLANTYSNGTNETLWDFDSTIESGIDSINILGNHEEGGMNGTLFAVGSLDLDTPKLNSSANNGIMSNSHADALLSMQANAVNTVIVTQSVPVLAAGTWVEEDTSQYTATAAGRLTYNGINTVRVPVSVRVSLEPASGSNKILGVSIAKNGTQVANSLSTIRTSSGAPISITLPWQLEIATGDYLEVLLSNESDAVDVLGSSAIFRVN